MKNNALKTPSRSIASVTHVMMVVVVIVVVLLVVAVVAVAVVAVLVGCGVHIPQRIGHFNISSSFSWQKLWSTSQYGNGSAGSGQ